MALNIGDTIGDYQIIGILGAGGMGKVYKVRNVISDRVEAMKVLLPDLANESELADRFVREIKLLASLDHPNIAALHTAMRMSNQLLMIMEFVEGTTLETRLREHGPIPPVEAAECASQVLAALAYAHERGVIHRDIKPANMMLTPSGAVKLMDFGIAKAKADRRLTMTGTTMGSLFYMSPEQVKGTADLDGRSDLYSVGVSLYEMVTGVRPFKGESDYSIMVAHLEQDPPPPVQVDPRVPPALSEVIMTAIQKDPANRFQTAAAFRGALESVKSMLGGAPSPAPPQRAAAPPPSRAPQPAAPAAMPEAAPARSGGHRGLYMALGGLVVLAVLAGAAVYGPKYFRAKATGDQPQTAQSVPAQPAPAAVVPPAESTPIPAPEPAAAQQAAAPAAETTAAAPPPAVAPPAVKSAPPVRQASSLKQRASQASAVPVQQAVPVQEASQPVARPPAQAPPPVAQAPAPAPAPSHPAVDTAALNEARERMVFLGSRASALRSSLQTLQRQQQASGLNLRSDMSASWKRMEFLLDEAEAALKGNDAAAAKRNLDMAEREADKLDKFLGR